MTKRAMGCSCIKTDPIPDLDASHFTMNFLLKLGKARTGVVVMASMSCWKAWSAARLHVNEFFIIEFCLMELWSCHNFG